MSRKLAVDMPRKLAVDDEPVFGAYDASAIPIHERFEIKEGDTSRDEEIARRLQMEELNPNPHEISPFEVLHWRNAPEEITREFERHKTNAPEVLRRERDSLQRELKAERERHTRDEQRIRELAEQQAREREERRVQEREERLERERNNSELVKTIKEIGDIAKTRELLRSTYPLEYDRIYNWSLTLLPDYYDIDLRSSLRSALSRLIKRELLLNSSEYEIERKIRKTILDAEEADAANKKLSAIVNEPQFGLTKSEPAAEEKPTKKPSKPASKKPTKKPATKSRKSAKKTNVQRKSRQKK
jgi:hypothetical protein